MYIWHTIQVFGKKCQISPITNRYTSTNKLQREEDAVGFVVKRMMLMFRQLSAITEWLNLSFLPSERKATRFDLVIAFISTTFIFALIGCIGVAIATQATALHITCHVTTVQQLSCRLEQRVFGVFPGSIQTIDAVTKVAYAIDVREASRVGSGPVYKQVVDVLIFFHQQDSTTAELGSGWKVGIQPYDMEQQLNSLITAPAATTLALWQGDWRLLLTIPASLLILGALLLSGLNTVQIWQLAARLHHAR